MAEFAGFVSPEQVADGPTSVVWRAYQAGLSRWVAIKVLRPTASLERFRSVARLIASLDHEHIVRVIDYVEAEGGAYLVQEWIAGMTLSQRWTATAG